MEAEILNFNITKVNHNGWHESYKLSNGIIDIIVLTDVGPRIIHFGFTGERNELKEYAEMAGLCGGNDWRIYGGHRLWCAPEDKNSTYVPDNSKVNFTSDNHSVTLMRDVNSGAKIRKIINISLASDEPSILVKHKIVNVSKEDIFLSPWALTVMAPGGKAIIPLPPRGEHPESLNPNSSITLWPYTDMSDPHWTWNKEHIVLKQSSKLLNPQKIGVLNKNGWLGYYNDSHFFLKTFDYIDGEVYPDLGCNSEVFANDEMTEIESLGPLTIVKSGEEVNHEERWYLFKDIKEPKTDKEINTIVLPMLEKIDN